tara:strand:+ start:327 stop:590 length:264 start_codon:yes stop_codon:yes gene_type:complete
MIWKIWKYALGSFADDKTRDYDNVVAIVRTIILFTYFTTNIFIISGVIRHWNYDNNTKLAEAQQEATKIQEKTTHDTGCQSPYQDAY